MSADTDEVVDRSKFLGGSDVAAVLGISPWRTPLELAREKRKPRTQTDDTKGSRGQVLSRGKRWESVVAEMLVESMKERGYTLDILQWNMRYTDPEHPFLAAEIDAEGLLSGGEVSDWPHRVEVNIELKTVHPFKVKEWGLSEDGAGLSDQIPMWYAAQVQHGMMVRGRNLCVVGALVGADYLMPYIVPRDDEIIGWLRPALVRFWQDCVLGGIDPDAINIDDVRRLYKPELDGIEISDEVQESYLRLIACKREIKAREAEIELHEFRLAKFMGKHQVLLDAEGKELVTFKEQSGAYLDYDKLKAEYPDAQKKCSAKWTKRILKAKGV